MTHYLADSISRLESGASHETAFDAAVPVFATRAITVRRLDAANYVGGPTVRGINRDAVLSAQAAYGYCQEVVKALHAGRRIPFLEEPDGILRRRAAPDGTHQVVVPASLQERVLHLEHDETLAGHPGESRMYAAMRRYYYWVGLAADVVSYVRKCDSCARQRVRPLARRSPLTLFPATMPFLANNSLPHRRTGVAPLERVSPMGVSSWAFKDIFRTRAYPLTTQRETAAEKRAQAALLTRLVQRVPQMRATLKEKQWRYKRYHHRLLALRAENLTVGSCAWLRDHAKEDGAGGKLTHVSRGPYRVVSTDGPTVLLDVDE